MGSAFKIAAHAIDDVTGWRSLRWLFNDDVQTILHRRWFDCPTSRGPGEKFPVFFLIRIVFFFAGWVRRRRHRGVVVVFVVVVVAVVVVPRTHRRWK